MTLIYPAVHFYGLEPGDCPIEGSVVRDQSDIFSSIDSKDIDRVLQTELLRSAMASLVSSDIMTSSVGYLTGLGMDWQPDLTTGMTGPQMQINGDAGLHPHEDSFGMDNQAFGNPTWHRIDETLPDISTLHLYSAHPTWRQDDLSVLEAPGTASQAMEMPDIIEPVVVGDHNMELVGATTGRSDQIENTAVHSIMTPEPRLLAPWRVAHPRAHARPTDWESHKSIISILYLSDNLPVPDLAAYMSSQYNFHATANMYKKQFRKWAWSKYKTSRDITQRGPRARDRTRKACRRGLDLRRSAIDTSKTADGTFEMLTGDFMSFVDEYRVRGRRSLATFWINDEEQQALRNSIHVGLKHLSRGNTATASKFLTLGLRTVAYAVEAFDGSVGRTILYQIPRQMIQWGQWALAEKYLMFLVQQSTRVADSNPVGRISMGLVRLLRQCQARTKHFIALMISHYARALPSESEAIKFQSEQIRCQHGLDIFTGDLWWEVDQLARKLDLEALKRKGGDYVGGGLETVIRLQDFTMQYCDNFLEQVRISEQLLIEQAGGSIEEFASWDRRPRDLYFSLRGMLTTYYMSRGDIEEATVVAEELSRLAGGLDLRDQSHCSALVDLESDARFHGMDDLARKLSETWQSSHSVRFILNTATEHEHFDILGTARHGL